MEDGNGAGRRVALYARASSDSQEYSTPGQLGDLRKALEAFEIVEEIADEGEKRHTIERPGVDRLRELAAAGGIDEVWAWAWDRFGEFPQPEVLALEMQDFGVVLRSLDDNGGGEASYEMNVIKSLFSRREQKTRVSRSRRGKLDKARRGEIHGTRRPRYGFAFVRDGKGRAVGYEPDGATMPVVRRIFEMVAGGHSLHAVQRELEGGGERWSRNTIRGIVEDDTYKPHRAGEVEGVPEGCGVNWAGRKRSMYVSSRSKKRRAVAVPPEEWIPVAVPLDGSGLKRETVEAARAGIKGNKSPAKVGDRFWELSGGVLRCAECGLAMIAYRGERKDRFHYWYRCRPSSTVDACANRKSHRAADLEERAWEMVSYEATDPEGELALRIAAAYGEQRRRLGAGGRARRAALVEALAKIENRRDGLIEMRADGDITKEKFRARAADLEEQERGMREELEATEDAAEQLAELERSYETVLETFAQGRVKVEVEESPEARQRRYKRMGIAFTVDRDGALTADWALQNGGLPASKALRRPRRMRS